MSDYIKPLIIQSDRTILVEVSNPNYNYVRNHLLSFSELEKSPEFMHTYRITPLSLWNAASAGIKTNTIISFLKENSRYSLPQNIEFEINDLMNRYGKLRLKKYPSRKDLLLIESDDFYIIQELVNHVKINTFIVNRINDKSFLIHEFQRGRFKQALINIGYPVQDLAGYIKGKKLSISLRKTALTGKAFSIRKYQREAINIFYADGKPQGGCGVIVLPCGAGKTIIGLGVIDKIQSYTLILVTNVTAAHQWRDELLDKTDLPPEMIGEYTGGQKEIRPITITTYQMVTYRYRKEDDFKHFKIFSKQNWGLIIYDEVHLLPAPVFRITSEIQARRRLGLTATLIREDGLESDVFSLIGPKKYDIPWKNLEQQGWIAEAECIEIRCSLKNDLRLNYATSPIRKKYRLAAENPGKYKILQLLVKKHKEDSVLIIGQYLKQLNKVAKLLEAPLITGKVHQSERDILYQKFKSGELPVLVVSKVANFAVDLPDANIAIQISGTYGSRQEEAQRLGRILRPKSDSRRAIFYTIVTKNSRDQDFSIHRQLFLTEQGYKYSIFTYDNESDNLPEFLN